ncbi:response regulator transcription factor [Fusibacter paucivorans]
MNASFFWYDEQKEVNTMQHILIAEDDQKITRVLELQLKYAGYHTVAVSDGKAAVSYALAHDCDLILMDVMMPELDGITAAKHIKSIKPRQAIIILTAKDDLDDIITGLDAGADDYVTKPFIFDELLARIRANIRKYAPLQSEEIHEQIIYDDLVIDPLTFEVSRDHQAIELSKTEFDLLRYLVINREIVLTREQILDQVWGFDYYGSPNIVDVYIKYLRDKIDRPFERKLIQTVRGRGYVIK